jgi:hypothetical protein
MKQNMSPEEILRARKKNGHLEEKFRREACKLGKYLSVDSDAYVMERMLKYVPPKRDCKHFGGKAT